MGMRLLDIHHMITIGGLPSRHMKLLMTIIIHQDTDLITTDVINMNTDMVNHAAISVMEIVTGGIIANLNITARQLKNVQTSFKDIVEEERNVVMLMKWARSNFAGILHLARAIEVDRAGSFILVNLTKEMHLMVGKYVAIL